MDTQFVQTRFKAMGTTCSVGVTAAPGDEATADEALDAARLEIIACERALSRFIATSDLSALNRAGGDWVPVGSRLLAALAVARDARQASDGRFDPTILPVLAAAGYDGSFEQLEQRAPETLFGWRAGTRIEIDLLAGRARLERGAAVDLGGIGKGWSADRTVARIRQVWPLVPGCLVDMGGDIAVLGAPPHGGPWLVDIADPRRPGRPLARLGLERGGVATSGRDARRFGPQLGLHHLIDPVTGRPSARGPLAVTVVASDAAQAEAHATALAVTPVEEAAAYIAARPGLAAFVVPDAGQPFELGEPPLAAIEQRGVRIKLTTPIGGLS
ncbi:MAG TPA: FAD:protein FMN transferase [Gaiellales bacterium]|nr:FAD:protein FMN transferase [Gaiellales bacterium]